MSSSLRGKAEQGKSSSLIIKKKKKHKKQTDQASCSFKFDLVSFVLSIFYLFFCNLTPKHCISINNLCAASRHHPRTAQRECGRGNHSHGRGQQTIVPAGFPHTEARTHRQHRLFIDKKLQSQPNRCSEHVSAELYIRPRFIFINTPSKIAFFSLA